MSIPLIHVSPVSASVTDQYAQSGSSPMHSPLHAGFGSSPMPSPLAAGSDSSAPLAAESPVAAVPTIQHGP